MQQCQCLQQVGTLREVQNQTKDSTTSTMMNIDMNNNTEEADSGRGTVSVNSCIQTTPNMPNVSDADIQHVQQNIDDHHSRIAESFNNMRDINNNNVNDNPAPTMPILLETTQRNIPSNQANIAMASTTNCITDFQQTFSQHCAGLPEACKPTRVIDHKPQFTDPLPGSTPNRGPWHAQQHPQYSTQYTSPNINNNASPNSYNGFERPNYGLVQQVLEVFRLSGKAEMQPSEVYYELEKNFPYYRYLTPQKRKSWMSSVRHALTNPQFKARRCTEEDGKPANRRGNFWSINDNYKPGQENTPTRPKQTSRRRSKVMSPGGHSYIKNSSPGQPLLGTSMMSPHIGYSNVQSNGLPMILPSTQFAGQAMQLVPAINSGMGGNIAYPKQTSVAGSGQFLWIPPNSSPQQQLQFHGNTWPNSSVATYRPAFTGNMQNNFNYSNNIQQQQLPLQHQQQQLYQQQQPFSAVLGPAVPAPKTNHIVHPQNNVTTSSGMTVIGNIKPMPSLTPHMQLKAPVKPYDTQVDDQYKAVDHTGDSASQQRDIGPGGDTTPIQQTNVDHEGTETVSIQCSQESKVTITQDAGHRAETENSSQDAEYREVLVSQDAESHKEAKLISHTGDLNILESRDRHNSSEQSSACQANNGLFPVTLYSTSNASNSDEEKPELPSIEQLTKSLTNQTVGPCSALGQISSIDGEFNSKTETEIPDEKNTLKGKAELRSMVFNEVCNTDGDQDPTHAPMIPNSQQLTSATARNSARGPYTVAKPSSTTVTVNVQIPHDTNEQWHVQQVPQGSDVSGQWHVQQVPHSSNTGGQWHEQQQVNAEMV